MFHQDVLLSPGKLCWGTVDPAIWIQCFKTVSATTRPTNTSDLSSARRAFSKEELSGFCYSSNCEVKCDDERCSHVHDDEENEKWGGGGAHNIV